MANMKPLYEWIGTAVCVIKPSTQSSDGVPTTDNIAGVPILGYDGVLFIELLGATDATDVSQIQIQYSSTGNASDAVTSNSGMTCTDAIFGIHPSAAAGKISLLDFSISAKGMSDAGGKLFAVIAADETGAAGTTLLALPYGGTRLLPATNAVSVVHAESRS